MAGYFPTNFDAAPKSPTACIIIKLIGKFVGKYKSTTACLIE
jgi:hypothetical protein